VQVGHDLRVEAQRDVQSHRLGSMRGAHVEQGLPRARPDRGHQDVGHPGGVRARQDLGTIVIEGGEVEVAVGIEEAQAAEHMTAERA
jgi:hypothetical protein